MPFAKATTNQQNISKQITFYYQYINRNIENSKGNLKFYFPSFQEIMTDQPTEQPTNKIYLNKLSFIIYTYITTNIENSKGNLKFYFPTFQEIMTDHQTIWPTIKPTDGHQGSQGSYTSATIGENRAFFQMYKVSHDPFILSCHNFNSLYEAIGQEIWNTLFMYFSFMLCIIHTL